MSGPIPTDPAAQRIWSKAASVVAAWGDAFGTLPTKHAVILAMSVAEFETRMGDAQGTWAGEHNWGAVTKRTLTKDEAATLAAHGISASGGEDAVLAARRLLRPGPNEALHRDSSPALGWYFVWFWAFATDRQAAAKFLTVLVRPNVAAIIDTATPEQLAAAMYANGYYTGTSKDPATNVANYTNRITATGSTIEAALTGWDPATSPAPDPGPAPGPAPQPGPIARRSSSAASAFFTVASVLTLAIAWRSR